MDWIDLLWRLGVVAVVAFAATFAWVFGQRLLARWDKPHVLNDDKVVIRPWPPLCFVMGALLWLVVLAGLGALFWAPRDIGLWLMMAVCFALLTPLALVSTLAALPTARIEWTRTSIEGPASQFWIRRREISWPEIERVGRTWFGSYYVESVRGDRIFWSDAHISQRNLWRAIAHMRPPLLDAIKQMAAANG